jgi:hypothetical protein
MSCSINPGHKHGTRVSDEVLKGQNILHILRPSGQNLSMNFQQRSRSTQVPSVLAGSSAASVFCGGKILLLLGRPLETPEQGVRGVREVGLPTIPRSQAVRLSALVSLL